MKVKVGDVLKVKRLLCYFKGQGAPSFHFSGEVSIAEIQHVSSDSFRFYWVKAYTDRVLTKKGWKSNVVEFSEKALTKALA